MKKEKIDDLREIDTRKRIKYETYNDHFENAKRYNIPKAQLIISDIPYNLGKNAYASSSAWYVDGDNKNGESDKANKEFLTRTKILRLAISLILLHVC